MIFNEVLDGVKVYEAGKPIELVVRDFGVDPKDIVKLASNENPNGCSPKVREEVSKVVASMAMYPDDSFYELKDKLAKRFDVTSSNVIIGAGSDQVIEFCIHAKCNKDSKILIAGTTFAMYEIYAKGVGATIIRTEQKTHNLEQFEALYNEHKPDMIFLCLPNNPLGECIDREDVYNFMDKIDKETMIVVDGAYQEYASYKDEAKKIDPKDLISRYENSIYLGTFSKAYGLGGMRVGYGISNSTTISVLHKLRPPFNITTLSLKAAIVALDDEEFVKNSVDTNFKEMDRYIEFASTHGYEYIESYTNFLTIILDKSSKEVSDMLLKNGIIVRDLSSYGLNAIRVTIGTATQNDKFFDIYEKIIVR
jgi:histidinol-phosphate aminotransferase